MLSKDWKLKLYQIDFFPPLFTCSLIIVEHWLAQLPEVTMTGKDQGSLEKGQLQTQMLYNRP